MKVFVSSTYEDLSDHRKALDEVLHRLSARFVGMEYFGARPFEPKTVCFTEIRDCDLFLGVYAHRYGWIPENDILSITEQEFDEARRHNKPCYCYIVDSSHPWPPIHIEYPALDKVKRLHSKVNLLVRAKFTTPDNLAKQASSDLVSALTQQTPLRSYDTLLGYLRTCAAHEISASVGTKYIPDLYVDRSLDRSLKLSLSDVSRVKGALGAAVRSLRLLQAAVVSYAQAFSLSKIRQAHHPYLDKYNIPKTPMPTLENILHNLITAFDKFSSLQEMDARMNYPADELNRLLQQVRDLCVGIQRSLKEDGTTAALQHSSSPHRNLPNILSQALADIASLEHTLKPVYLVVDRAGGGKTNLLCHLTGELGAILPTIFITAKSIGHPSIDGILRSLSAVYPIGADPIAAMCNQTPKGHCIVVIDGINEQYDPRNFNNALKDLIRHYYNKPVKFLVSCRDIYWRYFADDWWIAHGAFISKNALHSFTAVEHEIALGRYLQAFDIQVEFIDNAKAHLQHPLLLRFFCEAYRGSPAVPTKLGQLGDIRLFDLFDAYCNRKFEQIRSRLGLMDTDEIFQYVKVIALTILERQNRFIPVTIIAAKAFDKFGERSIRTVDSRYVQVLDEDILIEERPLSDLSETVVSFVYDEFMEYMIARSISAEALKPLRQPVEAIMEEVDKLFHLEKPFVSVPGILRYLGEILSKISESYLTQYIEALSARRLKLLVCELATKLAEVRAHPGIFDHLIKLHQSGPRLVRNESWAAIERTAKHHWKQLMEYLRSNPSHKRLQSGQAFAFLSRASRDLGPSEQYQTLELIWMAAVEKETIIYLDSSRDTSAAFVCGRQICALARSRWTAEQQAQADAWLAGLRPQGADLQTL